MQVAKHSHLAGEYYKILRKFGFTEASNGNCTTFQPLPLQSQGVLYSTKQ